MAEEKQIVADVENMTTDERVMASIDYYLANPGLSQNEATKQYKTCTKTLNARLDNLAKIYPGRVALFRETRALRVSSGRIKGGAYGGKSKSWTEEDAINLGVELVRGDVSIREMSAVTGIPRATVHGILKTGIEDGTDLKKAVEETFESHRHGHRR